MGRYPYSSRYTVEDSKSISIKFLKENNYLEAGWSKNGNMQWTIDGEPIGSIGIDVNNNDINKNIRFYYTFTDNYSGEEREMDYKFDLITTPCNFGGIRYWFICGLYRNGIYCGRRVSKLYKAPNSDYFGCRHCMDINYQSQREPNNRSFRIAKMYWKCLAKKSKI